MILHLDIINKDVLILVLVLHFILQIIGFYISNECIIYNKSFLVYY